MSIRPIWPPKTASFSTPRASFKARMPVLWAQRNAPHAVSLTQRTVSSTGPNTAARRKYPTFRQELEMLFTRLRRPFFFVTNRNESGVIVFHVQNIHPLWKISQFIPFVAFAVGVALSDNFWNHSWTKNPDHEYVFLPFVGSSNRYQSLASSTGRARSNTNTA